MAPAEAQSPETGLRPLVWTDDFAAGLEMATSGERLVALYFRPVGRDDPPVVRAAGRLKDVGERVVGVRVRADEVKALRERFGVDALPAVVVVDLRENVLLKATRRLPADLWRRIERLFQRAEESKAGALETIDASERALAAGRPLEAYRGVRPILADRATALSVLVRAAKIESAAAASGEAVLIATLAWEGLIDDDELAAKIRAAVPDDAPPALRARRDAELSRLRRATIGGA